MTTFAKFALPLATIALFALPATAQTADPEKMDSDVASEMIEDGQDMIQDGAETMEDGVALVEEGADMMEAKDGMDDTLMPNEAMDKETAPMMESPVMASETTVTVDCPEGTEPQDDGTCMMME